MNELSLTCMRDLGESDNKDLQSNQAALIVRRIKVEPRHETVLLRLLEYCRTRRSYEDICEELLSYPEMRVSAFSPSVILGWMVNVGAIAWVETGSEHSQVRNGSLLTGQNKECFFTTSAGIQALEKCQNEKSKELFVRDNRQNLHTFFGVLRLCKTPQSKASIEEFLRNASHLGPTKLLPGFFIDKLEKAHLIAWNKGWMATPEGIGLLAEHGEG